MKTLNKIYRGFTSFAMGVFFAFATCLIFSLTLGNGTTFYATSPYLMDKFGQINAAALTYLAFGLLGLVIHLSIGIFKKQQWSILKQVLVDLVVTSALLLPLFYVVNTSAPIHYAYLKYFVSLFLIHIILWIVRREYLRRDILKANQALNAK